MNLEEYIKSYLKNNSEAAKLKSDLLNIIGEIHSNVSKDQDMVDASEIKKLLIKHIF